MRVPRVTLAALAGVSVVVAGALTGLSAGVEAGAEPSTTETSATTSATAGASAYPSDQRGYIDTSARCDTDEVLMVRGRTARALVAICVDSDAELRYRGVRLSDEAFVELSAGRASDGSIVATNDGVTYSVSSAAFLVSEGDTVLYRDPWVEFFEGRFTEPPAGATSTSGSPTVSTTTVTMTPTATTTARSDG